MRHDYFKPPVGCSPYRLSSKTTSGVSYSPTHRYRRRVTTDRIHALARALHAHARERRDPDRAPRARGAEVSHVAAGVAEDTAEEAGATAERKENGG